MTDFEISRIESLHPPVIAWCNNNAELRLIEEATRVYYSKFPNERDFPLFFYRREDSRLNNVGKWALIYSYEINEAIGKGEPTYGYQFERQKEAFEFVKDSYKLTECNPCDIKNKLPEYFI